MKVGIQTNVWTGERHQDLNGLLAEAAAAGYDGIEIGAHRLDLDHPEIFIDLLQHHNLLVAGLHVHGRLQDPTFVETALAGYRRAAVCAAAAGAPYLLISGNRQENRKSDAELQNEVEALVQVAEICLADGLHLLYHNHYWEIEEDLRELCFLLDHIAPEKMSVALDVAWVTRAAQDPVEVIRRLDGRVGYLHLKDFRVKDFLTDTWTDLGDGYVNLTGVLNTFTGSKDTWITYERDEALDDALASAQKSRAYLRSLGY